MAAESKLFASVEVEMHALDKHSVVIEQEENGALRETPHYYTIVIRSKGYTETIVGLTVENYQLLTRRLYSPVGATLCLRTKESNGKPTKAG